jgi:hypothetical protein
MVSRRVQQLLVQFIGSEKTGRDMSSAIFRRVCKIAKNDY